jgi:hypothetical protein
MGFKLPEEYLKEEERINNLKYILHEDKEIHVSEFEDRSITPQEHSLMRMNSYAQDDLPPKLNNAALIKTARSYLSNCTRPTFPCTTYDEALIHKILPELIERLEELDNES